MFAHLYVYKLEFMYVLYVCLCRDVFIYIQMYKYSILFALLLINKNVYPVFRKKQRML